MRGAARTFDASVLSPITGGWSQIKYTCVTGEV